MRMVKNVNTYMLFFIILLLTRCENADPETHYLTFPKVVEAAGKKIHPDSMQPPVIVQVKNLEAVPAGAPDEIKIKRDKNEAVRYKTITLEKPDSICIPGQNSFKYPEAIPAAGQIRTTKYPHVIPASLPEILEYGNISYKAYNSRQGIKGNVILKIYNDSKGNIWIGNWGGGAVKFDGQSFIHYSHLQGLSNDMVEHILEDKNGNMWFGTYSGINKFDGKSITTFPSVPELNERIYGLKEGREGNLWILVPSAVYMCHRDSFFRFSNEQGLLSGGYTDMEWDKNGSLWIKTNKGFCRYDGKSFANYIYPNLSWTELKLALRDDGFPDRATIYAEDDEYLNLISVSDNMNEGLYFYEDDKGLYKIENNTISYLGLEKGLKGSNITQILKDNAGHYWIASNGGGIARSNGQVFSHLTTSDGLTNQNIRSVDRDKNGNIWIGTWNGGINRFNGTSILQYSKLQGLSSNNIEGFYEDTENNYWFNTWGNGADKFDGKTFTNYSAKTGLANDYVSQIIEDRNGNIWFATSNGLSKYDGKAFTNFYTEQGLSSNAITCILEDSRQNLWLGSLNNGITKYDGKSFTQFTEEGGLPDEAIYSLMEDDEGNIWIGTFNGGAIKFDGKTFTQFTVEHGLANNCVWSMLNDSNGYLWFGTINGLSRMKKNSGKDSNDYLNTGTSLFKNYFSSDGFLAAGVWRNSLVQDNDGNIWIGGQNMVSIYHPEEESRDTILPFVQLTGISLFNEDINWLELEQQRDTVLKLKIGAKIKNFEFSKVANWSYVPEQLQLNYNNNFITFSYVGITSKQPERVKYQYYLQGLDKNWNPVTSEAKATYTNLKHGEYTFNLKAANADGVWSDIHSYTFAVKPPFWLSWWSYGIYLIIFISGVWLATLYMRRRLERKEKLRMQQKELEHAHEIERAYNRLKTTQKQLIHAEKMASLGELTAGIAHEIQNPLNFVNNFSELSNELLDELKEELEKGHNDEVKILVADVIQNLRKINQYGKRAAGIIKGMLLHSRGSSGQKEPTDINKLADEYLRLSYHGFRAKDKTFNSDFKLEADKNLPKINVVPQDIGRVLLNLINNAFYAVNVKSRENRNDFKPEVIVTTIYSAGMERIEIDVKDNGPGIPSSIEDKIFQPFYTTKPAGQGTGLGLSLSYDIIKAHNGKITVESKKNEELSGAQTGTEFKVYLPIT